MLHNFSTILLISAFLAFAPLVTIAQTLSSLTSVASNTFSCLSGSGPVLKLGNSGKEVLQLQKVLNSMDGIHVAINGIGSPGNETNYFGLLTQKALNVFQVKYASDVLVPAGVSSPTGIFGPLTRAKLSFLCNAPHVPTDLPAPQTQSNPISSIISASTSPHIIATTPLSSDKPTLEWGVYSGYSASDLSTFENLVGKRVDLKAVFTNWNEEFPSDAAGGLVPANKTLVVFWEQYGVTLDDIIAGKYDAYIKKFATDAQSYGGNVILAPFHEMNGNWDSWDGTFGNNTPSKVVSAWKHVHDVFGTSTNVKFAWDVNNDSVPDTNANSIDKYYPGDAYVDYVAVDGFNFGSPWQTFDSVFSSALNSLAVYKKPIYILSMASAAGAGKATWITDALSVQIKKYPLLKGWVWFNENKERNWLVNSDDASLNAFKETLQ